MPPVAADTKKRTVAKPAPAADLAALPEAAFPAEFADLPDKARAKIARILAAALALFSEYGFHGTAVPQIAAAAEVGTGTIYRYFADKEALVNALYRAGKQLFAHEVWGEVQASTPEDAPFETRFRAVWRAMAGFASRNGQLFRFMELHHHAAYLDADSHAASEAVTAPGRDFVAAGIAAGAIREADPELLANLVWGALTGLVKGCAETGRALDEPSMETAGATLWAGLAAPAPRPEPA